MTNHQSACISAISILLIACADSGQDERRAEPALLPTSQATVDTINTHLIGRLRRLIAVVAARDSAGIAALITPDSKVLDTRTSESVQLGVARATRPSEVDYFGILAGGLSDRLLPDYDTFLAFPNGELATVYALAPSQALQTSWRQGQQGWIVYSIVVLRPEDARHAIDRLQRVGK
jgi:hypothetical protein